MNTSIDLTSCPPKGSPASLAQRNAIFAEVDILRGRLAEMEAEVVLMQRTSSPSKVPFRVTPKVW